MNHLLPDNPTRFDYLHAIRAIASRAGQREIFDLADEGMQLADTSKQEAIDALEWAKEQLGKHTRPSPIDKALASLRK